MNKKSIYLLVCFSLINMNGMESIGENDNDVIPGISHSINYDDLPHLEGDEEVLQIIRDEQIRNDEIIHEKEELPCFNSTQIKSTELHSSENSNKTVQNRSQAALKRQQTAGGWFWKRVMDKYVRGTSINILHELEVGTFDIDEFANYQRVDEAVSGAIASGEFKQVALLLEKLREVNFKPNNVTIESAYKFLKIKQLRDEESFKQSIHEKMSLYYAQRHQLLQKLLVTIDETNKEMTSQYQKFMIDLDEQVKNSLEDISYAKRGRVSCAGFLPKSALHIDSGYNSDYEEPSLKRYTEGFLLDRVQHNDNIVLLEQHMEWSQGLMNQVNEKLGLAISYKQ